MDGRGDDACAVDERHYNIREIWTVMRKVVVEISLNEGMRNLMAPILAKIDELEMVDLLRLDLARGLKIGVVRFRLSPGARFSDVVASGFFEVLEMIEDDGREVLCLIKANAVPGFDNLKQKADLDLKMVPPMRLTKEKVTYSFVGEDDQIVKMIELAKQVGEGLKVSVHQASFESGDLLSVLTEKQRSLMVMAKDMGYYEYPRRTSTGELARAAGLSTSTVIEHLRKSEVRLMAEIMAGQR
jgi:hypothetical protein